MSVTKKTLTWRISLGVGNSFAEHEQNKSRVAWSGKMIGEQKSPQCDMASHFNEVTLRGVTREIPLLHVWVRGFV
jgi:hypothetical protein